MKVPVVSSTHWDREWRFSFQQTRAMLVELMDHLAELLQDNPEFRCYHLDAQTVVLEDYLEIRPEKREALEQMIRDKRILVGPWYTLPDMCSIGGEPVVRNLLMGHRLAKEFGSAMKVGYTPTGFGQISQLPQIYAGFGIDTVLFYRGVDRDSLGKEFLWEAPDGSRAAAYVFTPEFGRMPLFHCVASDYYRGKGFYDRECCWDAGEGAFRLEDERARKDIYYQSHPLEFMNTVSLRENIQRLVETEMKKSSLDTFLLLDGVDSTEPQPLLVKLLEDMNHNSEGMEFYHTGMEDFASVLREKAEGLEVYRGEMRTSAKYPMQVNLMGSAISSRIYLKQGNDKSEKKLMGWAETFSAFAWALGAAYPSKYLKKAWKYLLWNQSHDCIAGCSQDIVHEDMEYYFRQCDEIADTLTANSLFHIAQNISGDGVDENAVLLVVFNPLPVERREVVDFCVDLPAECKYKGLRITDVRGLEMVCQSHGSPAPHKVLVHRPKDVPGIYSMTRWNISFLADNIPACGYKTFIVSGTENSSKARPGDKEEHSGCFQIQNEYISVTADSEGVFTLKDLISGQEYTDLNRFEDSGEAGDPWIRKVPAADSVVSGPAGKPEIRIEQDELSGTITVGFILEVPVESDAAVRSIAKTRLKIGITATVNKGSPRLDFRTTVNNTAKDHRLRVLFPSGVKTDVSHAEMPFEIVKRNICRRDTKGWYEKDYATFPMRGFTAVMDGTRGLAVLTRGLPEYEVMDDEKRTVAITLLRCHRMYIPKIKTYDAAQQGSQCLGEHVFEYSVMPFSGDSLAGVLEQSRKYSLPVRTAQSSRQKGTWPQEAGFLTVNPPIALSAVKKAEDREALVVRLYNPTGADLEADVSCLFPLQAAYLLDMEENRLEEVAVYSGTRLKLPEKPFKILTVELVPFH